MLKEDRFEYILTELKAKKSVRYEDLASLPVSEDTIRRDIDYLHRNGLLSKVRGGAILRSKDPLSYEERASMVSNSKEIVAMKARRFIKDGMTLFMDGGTTICALGSILPADVTIRIITNNMKLVPLLTARYKKIELIVLGGLYNKDTATVVGVNTCREVSTYIADAYFLGACAIDYNKGVSAIFRDDAIVKVAMAASSKKIIVLADQNKLRRTEPFKVVPANDISTLVTDLPSDHQDLDEYRHSGISIV